MTRGGPSTGVALCLLAGLAAAEATERIVADFDATWRAGRWRFSDGEEFPGAKGSFGRAKAAARNGQWGGRLSFDFSGGGNYVAAILPLKAAPDVAAVRAWVRKPPGHRLTFRYTDRTGQTLQRGFWAPDGRWAEVRIPMSGWTGHWGGANDGEVHGAPKLIAILVENTARATGELAFDDVRLVEGKAGKGAGMVNFQYAVARFAAPEGWGCHVAGPRGGTKLTDRKLRLDFTRGAASIGVVPPDRSLLGVPQEIRLRYRGAAPGHPVRVRLATHFMTFEKTVAPLDGGPDGKGGELVIPAPPGEAWRWFGGENDGKLHGPLRLRGFHFDAGGRKDVAELELLEIRVKTACPPERRCVMTADLRRDAMTGTVFVATVRSVDPQPMIGSVTHTIRDWSGKVVGAGCSDVRVSAGAGAAEVAVPVPPGGGELLECEFILHARGQVTPPAQAYHVAPIQPRGSDVLDPSSPFGMGLYLYRYPSHAAGLKEMARAARLARDAGVKWSREEFGWARIQPARGKWDWSFYDAVVDTAHRNGISVYGLLSYWSAWTKPYTKEGMADYCRYAAAAATRYRGRIRHWEVWNEPNIFFWQGPRDLYAELLKQAYAAIKKANPDAIVLGCSTAGIDGKFIRRTMQLGAPFDVLTIHPYRRYLDDRKFITDLQSAAALVRRADGTDREVWITEMGWATHTLHNGSQAGFDVTTQREQAKLLARAYIDAIASAAAPNVSWYDFRNDGTDPFNFEHNLGVMTRDFRPKPAYRALATVTSMLKGRRVEKALKLGEGVIAYRLADARGAQPVTVLWSADEPRSVAVPADREMALTDLMGGRRTLRPAAGSVSVPLRPLAPVFLTPARNDPP